MSSNIDVKTRKRERSLLGTLGVSLLGGQSLFVYDFYAVGGPGQVGLAAVSVGDITKFDVEPGRRLSPD